MRDCLSFLAAVQIQLEFDDKRFVICFFATVPLLSEIVVAQIIAVDRSTLPDLVPRRYTTFNL